jgi:hypothetical protein
MFSGLTYGIERFFLKFLKKPPNCPKIAPKFFSRAKNGNFSKTFLL